MVTINLNPGPYTSKIILDGLSEFNTFDGGYVAPGKVSLSVKNCFNTDFYLRDRSSEKQVAVQQMKDAIDKANKLKYELELAMNEITRLNLLQERIK